MRACYLLATVPARVWQGPHAGMHPSQKNKTKNRPSTHAACFASFFCFWRDEFTERHRYIRLSLPETLAASWIPFRVNFMPYLGRRST